MHHRSSGLAPTGLTIEDGNTSVLVEDTGYDANVPYALSTDTLWYRVISDGNETLTVKVIKSASAPSQNDWDDANVCFYNDSGDFPLDGGYLGFTSGWAYIDDLTIEGWDASASDWKTEMVEDFNVTGDYAQRRPAYDAAGNLVYDGLHKFTYDAWNRLAKVERAWRDGAAIP